MADSDPDFTTREAHRAWLAAEAQLPAGFRAGTTRFGFTPAEVGKPAHMDLTVLASDEPSDAFAAVFTRNAFAGAPVIVGRRRLHEPALGAILVNNKIANVCAPGGEATVERLCAALGARLGLPPSAVLTASTGVIGWRLPEDEIIAHLDQAVAALQGESVLPAAEAIITTDLYPKVRSLELPGGARLVGIAKGAGMIEPDLATMLVYLLTDADLDRGFLREVLPSVVDDSFNCISIDSDTSTSDSVVLWSSRSGPVVSESDFSVALATVCRRLAEDVVRNGEGVRHVQRVSVLGAPDRHLARSLGKAVINAPLWKCALAGNDANVGRLVQAIGKHLGSLRPGLPVERLNLAIGDEEVFAGGTFHLDPQREARLAAYLEKAQLYSSQPAENGTFTPPVSWPPHPRRVEITIDLGLGDFDQVVVGNDLTHEYVSENADYRS